jgi:hypothetical protein
MMIAVCAGVFVVLLAATAMTRRSEELDPALEEQPIEQWTATTSGIGAGSSTQLRLS